MGGFYDKNMIDKDESVIFWFYQFLEKHTYTHIGHINFTLFIDPRPNSTCLSTFPPAKRSRKAIKLEIKRLLFLESSLHTPWYLGKM